MTCPVDSQECQIRNQCTNKCGRLDHVTPDIEHYIRCSVTVGQWTVEPGIEYRDGDDESELASGIECMASAICGAMHEPRAPGPMAVSRSFEWSFRSRWPGRAFFIEIHSTDHRWTQTFQPYGVPRRERLAGALPEDSVAELAESNRRSVVALQEEINEIKAHLSATRQPDPLSDEPNLWRDLYGELSKAIHATLGGKPAELVEDAAKRVVSERDFYSRKVYDAVDSARRAKDERDAAIAERDSAQATAQRLLDLQDEAIKAFGMPGAGLAEAAKLARAAGDRIAMMDGAYKNAVVDRDSLREQLHEETVARRVEVASLASWRTQAQVLGNQVLAARDAIDGRNADTLTEAIDRLRSELGASDGETLRQAVLRVLTERDAAVSRLEGV